MIRTSFGTGSGSIATKSSFIDEKCDEPVKSSITEEEVRPTALHEVSGVTPSHPAIRSTTAEVTSTNRDATDLLSRLITVAPGHVHAARHGVKASIGPSCPGWAPRARQRVTTLSPSASWYSTVLCASGKA